MPPTISATDQPLEKLSADAVVVAVGKGPDGPLPTPGAEAVDRLLGGRLFAALADLGARGGEDEVTRLPSFGQGPFPVVAVTGLGAPDASGSYSAESVRRAAGAASRALAGRRSVVSLLAAVGGAPDAERLHAVGEGRCWVPTSSPPTSPTCPRTGRCRRRRSPSSSRAPPTPRRRCAGPAPSPTPSRSSATW